MTFVILFAVAFTLLAMFIAFRVFEEKRHVRLWGKARTSIDEKVTEAYEAAVTGSIPRHYRIRFFAFLQNAFHNLVLAIVAGLRAIERPLTRLSYRMRMAASSTKKKEVSSFLKTIAPEKPDVPSGDGTEKEKSV